MKCQKMEQLGLRVCKESSKTENAFLRFFAQCWGRRVDTKSKVSLSLYQYYGRILIGHELFLLNNPCLDNSSTAELLL